MLGLSICLYFLTLGYWLLDVLIVHQELLVFIPKLFSTAIAPVDTFKMLTEMLGVHWYMQTVFQTLIVRESARLTMPRNEAADTVFR